MFDILQVTACMKGWSKCRKRKETWDKPKKAKKLKTPAEYRDDSKHMKLEIAKKTDGLI
jgi:hypothetical protein